MTGVPEPDVPGRRLHAQSEGCRRTGCVGDRAGLDAASKLAISWTLANPAVHVAIVGTRNHAHVDEALVAASLDLDEEVMQRIGDLMISAVPVAGPAPEEM